MIQTLGTFWTKAADRQRTVMAAILSDARSIPAGGTLILDGACPEVGPTPVFADNSDLVATLKLELQGRAPGRADVASGGLGASHGRLEVTIRYRTISRSEPIR